MAEWSNAAVLKTVEVRASGGSNPSLSAISLFCMLKPSNILKGLVVFGVRKHVPRFHARLLAKARFSTVLRCSISPLSQSCRKSFWGFEMNLKARSNISSKLRLGARHFCSFSCVICLSFSGLVTFFSRALMVIVLSDSMMQLSLRPKTVP